MTEIQVENIVDLVRYLDKYEGQVMFRGQANSAWPLLPSIVRFAQLVEGYDCISDLEDHILEKFIHFGVPFRDLRNLSHFECLVHAQHYGLPTRLLDWSSNPLKAAFFAVENAEYDSVDGAIYITEPKGWWEGLSKVSGDCLSAFYPELLNDRIAGQDACFMSFPLSNQNMDVPELSLENYPESMEFLHKMIIPKENKLEFRRRLSTLGVMHQTIYPGLEGTSKWVKSYLSNYVI